MKLVSFYVIYYINFIQCKPNEMVMYFDIVYFEYHFFKYWLPLIVLEIVKLQ